MLKLRLYGLSPYKIAVIHGGPGAGGELAPVARQLASKYGVLEPIQTADTLEGQVAELAALLEDRAVTAAPVTLIGYSWGAWLSWITAARFPALVRKLILVSSGPFEEGYTAQLLQTRQQRLTAEERAEFEQLVQGFGNSQLDQNRLLARLGALASKTDEYDPDGCDTRPSDKVSVQGQIYAGVWPAAAQMRRDGSLLALAGQIRCPVVAIHGEYDPHPAAGVRAPLSARLPDFRMRVLPRCGHSPWLERQAREDFYRALEAEVGEG